MSGVIVSDGNMKANRTKILLRTSPWWGGKSKHSHGKMTTFLTTWQKQKERKSLFSRIAGETLEEVIVELNFGQTGIYQWEEKENVPKDKEMSIGPS